MALSTTPEALHELALLHAKIQQLERLCGIRAPGDAGIVSGSTPSAAGLPELIAGFVDDMLVICDVAGTVLFANQVSERVLGYRPHELVGTNAWGYVHPDDMRATAAARSAPLDDGIPFENRARAPDGTYRWLEFTARRWPRENPTHVVLRFRRAMHREERPDPQVAAAPSRLHAQLRYAASLARLSQLALGLPLVSDVLDAGTSLGASGLGVELGIWLVPAGDALRVEADAGLEPSVRGLRVPIATSLAGMAWTRRAPTDETQLSGDLRESDPLLTGSGAVSAVAVPVRGADRLHGVLVLASKGARSFEPEDVHFAETVGNVLATSLDSRAAQEALSSRERLTRAVFDHARDGLVIVDDDGRCVDANHAAHTVLGVPAGSLRGRRPREVAGTTLDLAQQTRGSVTTGETTVRAGDGSLRSIEFELVSRILPGLGLAILRDVTERRPSR